MMRLVDTVEKKRLLWYGHGQRMAEDPKEGDGMGAREKRGSQCVDELAAPRGPGQEQLKDEH